MASGEWRMENMTYYSPLVPKGEQQGTAMKSAAIRTIRHSLLAIRAITIRATGGRPC
jgi:hypothetical protein